LLLVGCRIILRGRLCSFIVLNVQPPCEYKSDDVKDSFHKVLGHVFDQFPGYKMKILLIDFNVKVGKKIFSNGQSGTRVYTKLVMIWI
jgi:hypothetical protein